ncbi:hypothetical protein PAMP_014712 [Pampus punctatissimus]
MVPECTADSTQVERSIPSGANYKDHTKDESGANYKDHTKDERKAENGSMSQGAGEMPLHSHAPPPCYRWMCLPRRGQHETVA